MLKKKTHTKPKGLNSLMDMTETRVSEVEVRRSEIILCKQWTEPQVLLNSIECERERDFKNTGESHVCDDI